MWNAVMRKSRYIFKTRQLFSIGRLLFCFAFAPLGWSATPQAPSAITSATEEWPRIQFSKPVYDFGKVTCGEVLQHDFEFTNTGSQLLVINDVHTSCGCTTAKNWSREIPPGKAGTISINFYTVNFSGPVAKSITVACNDTNQPVVTLQIKGTVWRPIEVTPQSANFTGPLDTLSNLSRTILIVNQDGQPLTLSPPVTSHRAITAELEPNQPGKEYRLRVTLVPPLGAGNLFGQVTLKTSNPKIPALNVPVYAIVRPGVMVLPAELEIPASPTTNKVSRTVAIRNNSSAPLELSDPAVNAKGVELSLAELQPGQLFSIVLTFPEGYQPAKGEPLELTFKSNHPQFPLLKVPIVSR